MKCCSVTLQGAIHACATLPLCSHATQLTVFGSLLQKSKIVILLDNFSLAKTDANGWYDLESYYNTRFPYD